MLGWLKQLLRRLVGAGRTRGETGERLAAKYLRRERRFDILVRNWRSPRDRRAELDLVCRDGDVLVFVEVKTRAPGALVPGIYTVNARKKRALRRACESYLRLLKTRPRTYRLDVVEVSLPESGAAEILHFENIPLFPKRGR
jgi:putative endonuclease